MNQIISADCRDKCVYELRGKIYLDAENYDKALKDFEIAASMDPNYP